MYKDIIIGVISGYIIVNLYSYYYTASSLHTWNFKKVWNAKTITREQYEEYNKYIQTKKIENK